MDHHESEGMDRDAMKDDAPAMNHGEAASGRAPVKEIRITAVGVSLAPANAAS